MMPARCLAVAALLALAVLPARAEGSRELTSSGGYRPWLEAGNGADATSGLPRDNRFYTFLNAGETLLVASSAVGVGTGTVEFTRPNGTTFRLTDVAACVNGGGNPTRGKITSLAAELAGPAGPNNTASGAYTACNVTVPAGQGGVWQVRFVGTGTSPGEPTPVAARTAWTQPASSVQIAAWDVTVRTASGTDVPGRTYALYLPLNLGGYKDGSTAVTNSALLYVLTRDGYRYEIDQNGMVPYGYIVMANRRGFTQPGTGAKLYRSVTRAEIAAATVGLNLPTTPDTDVLVSQKLFLRPPAADLPATAPIQAGKGADGSAVTWLNTAARLGGAVSAFSFTGASGTAGQLDPDRGGTFRFTTDTGGAHTLRVDLDGNGTFETTLLRGETFEGVNTVVWNGTDAGGARLPRGTYSFQVGVVPRRGEVHFPYFDVEQNLDGLILTRKNGPAAPDYTVYWDDRALGAGGTASLAGTNSQTGAHRWGTPGTSNVGTDFGNEVAIDTWAYVDFPEVFAQTTIRAAELDLAVDVQRRTDPAGVGEVFEYAVVVTNNGPEATAAAPVATTLPARLGSATWTCSVTTAAPGPVPNRCDAAAGTATASGTGNVNRSVSLNPGASVTFVLRARHDGSAGSVTLPATVNAGDARDTNPANNSDSDTVTPQTGADLSVRVVPNTTTPSEGGPVTFTVTLTNSGPQTSTGVRVDASLAGDAAVSGATAASGTYAAGAWTPADLAPGASTTLTVTATAGRQPATLTAQVGAASRPDPDSTPGNNVAAEDDQDAATITPTALGADLDLALAVSDAAPPLGTDVTFTATVANRGPAAAGAVGVAFPLPAGYTLQSAASSAGTYTNGAWTVGALAAGSSATLAVVARATAVGPRTATAEVSASDRPDPDSTPGNGIPTEDDQASVAVSARPPDLALTVATDTATPAVGQTVTLTVALVNDGPAGATGVAVTAPLPAGYTLQSATPSAGTYASGVWTVGPVAAGATPTLVLRATATAAGVRTFGAEVTASDQPDADSTPGNDDASEDDQDALTLTAAQVDLGLTADVDDSTAPVGRDVTFTLTLSNTGGLGATGVTVSAPLPTGFTFVRATPSAGTYASGVWSVGPVAAGGAVTLDVVATVASPTPSPFVAEVSAQNETDADSAPGNGVATEDDYATATVAPAMADLRVRVTADEAAPAPGQTVTFTVTVTNDGPVGTSGVALATALRGGLTAGPATTSAGTYTAASGAWAVGALGVGETATLTLQATASGPAPGTLTAEVSASDRPDPDSTPGNSVAAEDDQDAATVTPPVIDLALAMTVSDATPAAGSGVTFRLALTNEGAVAATGVQVANALQDRAGAVEIVAVRPSRGVYADGVWTVGALAPAETATLEADVRLLQDRVAFTSQAEVAAADQPDADSTPYNGRTDEDDFASATATTGGTSSGGEGGLESNGSMAQALASVLFGRRQSAARGEATAPTPFAPNARGASALAALLPAEGPGGSRPVAVTPSDLLPVTNARDVVAVDYVRAADGRRLAAVFATATAPREVYEHTKPVCDRLRGARLDAVETVRVDGHPFVLVRLAQPDGSVDYAVSFVVYRSKGGPTVDSRFLLHEYDTAAMSADAEVLNVQVWSASREGTAALVGRVLAALDGPVTYRTDGLAPALPAVFVQRAEYAGGRVTLEMYNAAGARSLTLSGGTLARTEGGGRTLFTRTVDLPAGTPARPSVSVAIETGYVFDIAFFVETDRSPGPDRLYLADGTWGVALDPAAPTARLDRFDVWTEDRPESPGVRLVERTARATGTTPTWATLYRTLRAGGQPLDVSGYTFLEFTAAGEGDVHVVLQSASAPTDVYGTTVRLTPDAQTHRIWFADLRRSGGERGFRGTDVVSLQVTARGDGQAARPFEIALREVRFGGGEGDTSGLPAEPTLLPPAPNPFATRTSLRFELPDAGPVRLTVYDLLGRVVAVPLDGERAAGRHAAEVDGSALAAGVYVVRLDAGGRVLSQRMTVVRR